MPWPSFSPISHVVFFGGVFTIVLLGLPVFCLGAEPNEASRETTQGRPPSDWLAKAVLGGNSPRVVQMARHDIRKKKKGKGPSLFTRAMSPTSKQIEVAQGLQNHTVVAVESSHPASPGARCTFSD